ncbi:DUF72 domain-containing protein [Marinomonas sp. 2405UD68-3]|uniref:DUF72 domain-containing protein n=1 Tax=Marinomonas sp. 2405UD68-3 TaxID=3391835 RepID=UPI0039C8F37C
MITMELNNLYFGMAQWNHPDWMGWLYKNGSGSATRLEEYARFFNSVEVGSSFYADLTDQTIKQWYEQVPQDFRFSFKIPQEVTHQLSEQTLAESCERLKQFCHQLSAFEGKLGATMMQFPATVGPQHISYIEQLCDVWSLDTALSVEVRHLDFFDKADTETAFLRLLSNKKMNRVIMDSRPVFSTDAYCDSLLDAQQKKPKVPCHPVATSAHPVIRYIGHPDMVLNDVYLDQWAKKLCEWIHSGHTPYVFVHSSDNVKAPLLAQALEAKVLDLLGGYTNRIVLPTLQEQESLF